MSGMRILVVVVVGVMVALAVVQWAGQADPVPPEQAGLDRPLKRFERFTVYNSSDAAVVVAHLEFELKDGTVGRTVELTGVRIPAHSAWDISPSETGDVVRVRFQYGIVGSRKWFEIKSHPEFVLTSAGATIAGPNHGDVTRSGTEMKIQPAEMPPPTDD